MRLIDADAFIQMMEEKCDPESTLDPWVLSVCRGGVKMMPVWTVTVRHGKWVDENGNRPYGYRFNWLCSECGRPQHTPTAKLLKEFEEEHRWCHFCGIRMDGKDGDGNG